MRPEAFAPPGRSASRTGVSSGKACVDWNPQPCGLTTKAMQEATNGHLRSMLVTVTGISTRNRVLLRRVDRGVIISICENSSRPQAQGGSPHLFRRSERLD